LGNKTKGDVVSNLDTKALQMILSCSDNFEHIGGRLYKFTFENLLDVVVVAQQTSKGWRVISVSND
jgi:hypothetical protein